MPPSSTSTPRTAPAEVFFAGLRFTPLSVQDTVEALAGRPPEAPFVTFVTPNAEHAWLRRHNDDFRACSDACWISTNDSRVIGRADDGQAFFMDAVDHDQRQKGAPLLDLGQPAHDGVDIAGATAQTLLLAEAQVDKAITAVARYTDGHGSAESVSSAATPPKLPGRAKVDRGWLV